MIEYKDNLRGFWDLWDSCWGCAKDRLQDVIDNNLQDDFWEMLEERFQDLTPTFTEINDFIWFECDEWLNEHIKEV